MDRRTSLAAAALVAACVVACTPADHDPVAPPASPEARLNAGALSAQSVTPSSTAWMNSATQQTIKGWGLYPAAGTGAFFNRPTIQDALYNMGATLVREQIDPSLYVSGTTLANMTLNTSLLNGYITKIQYAKAHGVTGYIMSVWSPPAVFKTNNSILGEVNGVIGSLKTGSEDAFTAYLTRVVWTLSKSAIGAPLAISIQNEPEVAAGYGGNTYGVAQWQRVMQKVRGSFDYNGLSNVTLIGPETGQYTIPIYSNYLTNAPGYFGGPGYPALTGYMDHALGAYAFHTYAECSINPTLAAIKAHPKDMWMTEYGNPQGSDELAWTLDMASALAAHLVIIPHNYWFWWMGYAVSSSAPPFGQLLSGTTTPIYSKRYYVLQKLWTTVRPGWRVHTMTSSDPTMPASFGSQDPCTARINISSFTSADGTQAVIMFVNTTVNNKQIQVQNLPGAAQHSWRTDASNNMVAQTASNVYKGASTVSVPAHSVVIALMN